MGQLLPLIPEEKLHAALSERQRIRSVMAVAQGGSRLALEQAQVRVEPQGASNAGSFGGVIVSRVRKLL